MRDSVETFNYIEQYHQAQHAHLRESRRKWEQAKKDNKPEEEGFYADQNCACSSTMIALRDIGRFMLGIDPEDDSNPFDGPDDY